MKSRQIASVTLLLSFALVLSVLAQPNKAKGAKGRGGARDDAKLEQLRGQVEENQADAKETGAAAGARGEEEAEKAKVRARERAGKGETEAREAKGKAERTLPEGLDKQREKKQVQNMKELDKGSEQGQQARAQRRKWWKFWGE